MCHTQKQIEENQKRVSTKKLEHLIFKYKYNSALYLPSTNNSRKHECKCYQPKQNREENCTERYSRGLKN